jgi:uncharacterized protein (TIGR03435 family)
VASGRLAFEVATIKPTPQADLQGVYGNLFPMMMRNGPGGASPGRISFNNAFFRSTLMSACGLKQYQISGVAWTGFNI